MSDITRNENDPIHTEDRGDNRSRPHSRKYTVRAQASVDVQRDGDRYVATLRHVGNCYPHGTEGTCCIESDLDAAIDAALLSAGLVRL